MIFFGTTGFAQVVPGQTDQFGGSKCALHLTQELQSGKEVIWRLTTPTRTLGNGVSKLKQSEATNTWSFEFKTPEIKPGAVLDASLFFHTGDPQSEQQVPLRLRSSDPFSHIQDTLRKQGIVIFDPSGKTAESFADLSIKPNHATSLKQIAAERFVLVGENVLWDKRMAATIQQMAANGKWVIVFRPADESSIPMMLLGTGRSLSFQQLDQCHWFPEKIDADFWPRGQETSFGWRLTIEKSELRLIPAKGPDVWQLATYQYQEQGGVMLYIGVPLISRWNDSPVPREWLAHILEQALAKNQNDGIKP